jgi:hypothetical protein
MTKIAGVLNSPSIDSLQIRIPLSLVDDYSDSLTENTILISETGEVLEERTANRVHLTKDKALSFQVKNVRHSGRENISCVQIMATSKLLKGRYLDGINKDNFKIIQNAIQREGLIKIRPDVLLTQGLVTDVDIKADAYLPSHVDFVEYTKQLERDCRISSKIGEGCKRYNNQNQGQGIQFGTRKTATVSLPFFKVYNKCLELLTNSSEFTKENLSGNQDLSGLVRTEVTVKNREAFKRVLGTSDNTLGNLLSFSPTTLNQALTHAGNAHLSKITKYCSRTTQGLSGNSLTIYNFMQNCLESGMCLDQILELATTGHDKKGRQRSRLLINDLFNRYQLEGVNLENESDFGLSLFGVK